MARSRDKRLRTICKGALLTLVGVLLGALAAEASTISGTGTAELLDEGPYAGWYQYTYDATWDLSKGLSHLDLILKPGCVAEDHLFHFDTDMGGPHDGLSTGEGWGTNDPVVFTVPYQGFFEVGGDPSVSVSAPVVKWEPDETDDEPGKQGVGTFWFYSNVIPEYSDFGDVMVAKYGPHKKSGNLSGAYPSCEIIPEPFTAGFLGAGLVLVFVMKRR
ncbi:MAG: hypothetical protein WBD05_00170 [Phycisphaerae bacterium]